MIVSESTSFPLSITLFGPMHVQVAGRPLPRLRSRKSLWLLALLTLRHGRPVEREWLAGTLWPDIDQSPASANLRVVLSELRRALGSEGGRLQSPSRHTLSLGLDGADVDVRTFDESVTSRDATALEQAVALYRGPLLEGCAEEWVGQERAAREMGYLQALQTLGDAALAAGHCETAAGYYRRAVSLDPWREASQRGLMEALSRTGDANAAVGVYQTFVRLLRKDDPRAAPDELTTALYARLRAEARRRVSTPTLIAVKEEAAPPAVTGYLPHPLTDLVGREDEREEVAGRLRRSRLVTLTGPGGIGKTRLALAVAEETVPDYADGVWLVALEALTDGAQVPVQIAGVLGLKEEAGRTPLEGLTNSLRSKRLLLVLDNCEHLLDASARLTAHLLEECAAVRILATSRESLGITGETAWAVPGLSVPEPARLPAGMPTLLRVLAGYEGVQLFVERAQAVQKTFALARDNARAVAQVCAQLEGIPLAIELAAVRVMALTVAQIAARLDDHLGLLTGGSRAALSRQRTLRATLDWSYDLLSEPEQTLLRRLSVFAGGWTLEAAEGACAGDGVEVGQILDLLTSLIEKSLLLFEDDETGGRYRMLEMVRQYAWHQLQASGATDRMRVRHRDWFAALADEAGEKLRGAEQVPWMLRLERDQENFRAALMWGGTDAGGGETSLRMAGKLWWPWHVRGYLSEGRQILDHVLAREEPQGPIWPRARVLLGSGVISLMLGDIEEARVRFEESLGIFRVLGDVGAVASALGNLGYVAFAHGEYELARQRFAESLEITRDLGRPQPTAASLGNLAHVALAQGDYAAGWALNTEALGIFQTLEDKQGIARTLTGLANVADHRGDPEKARTLYDEALALFRELQEPRGICDAVSGLGNLEMQRGHSENARTLYRESLILRQNKGLKEGIEYSLREIALLMMRQREMRKAVLLWGSAEVLREAGGSRLIPITQRLLERDMAEARIALGEPAFAAAWEQGRALTWEQAATYAQEAVENLPSDVS